MSESFEGQRHADEQEEFFEKIIDDILILKLETDFSFFLTNQLNL
jgi:hypothetical protein